MPKVLIAYAANSKLPRRVVVPDDDAEIADTAPHLMAGENALVLEREVFHSAPIRTHIAYVHGIDPSAIPSGRCAVVDASGTVVAVIMADPDLDTHPDGRLIPSDTANIGDKLP